METVAFRQLPLIAKVAVGVAFFNSWVSFEEFVVNRSGLWRYMPYYRMTDPCIWDLGAALLVVIGLWQLSRQRGI
jgi:hypothetical protein